MDDDLYDIDIEEDDALIGAETPAVTESAVPMTPVSTTAAPLQVAPSQATIAVAVPTPPAPVTMSAQAPTQAPSAPSIGVSQMVPVSPLAATPAAATMQQPMSAPQSMTGTMGK